MAGVISDTELPAKIFALDAFVFRAPLETPRVNSFGTMTYRSALAVRLRDNDGAEGWGECFSNWPAFGAEHRYNILTEIMRPLLVGKSFQTPSALSNMVSRSGTASRSSLDQMNSGSSRSM